MKTIYIPKGETIRYESLATEHLVVHGCLQVTCGITAKTITGYGTVHAGTVNADVIRVDDMDAGSIVCKRLLAKRVQSPEVFASESAAVSCFLSSAYAYVRGVRPELTPGTQLSHVRLTTRKQDTVVFCVLESYEVYQQGQQAA